MLKDALAPFAFFVLLRWVERQEREEEAFALFDEHHYEPLLPKRLSSCTQWNIGHTYWRKTHKALT